MNLNTTPRRRYVRQPTPIERLDRLTHFLGGPDIYIKRDDLTGLTGGGNKTRKLEFLVADALARGCDTLITTGSMQSNHCRLTLAAAVVEGLKCHLVLRRPVARPDIRHSSGNGLLFELLGAEVSFIGPDADADAEMANVCAALERAGHRGYVIPLGGSNVLGSLGYVACAAEIATQCFESGLQFDRILCASGSGGTPAGLLAGLTALHDRTPLIGINVRLPAAVQDPTVRRLASQVLQYLGTGLSLPPETVISRDEWLGSGYGMPSEAMIEAVRLLARLEGVLLDPVYSGKAMAGLIGMVRASELRAGQAVLFVHTGGSPALFAYERIFSSGEAAHCRNKEPDT